MLLIWSANVYFFLKSKLKRKEKNIWTIFPLVWFWLHLLALPPDNLERVPGYLVHRVEHLLLRILQSKQLQVLVHPSPSQPIARKIEYMQRYQSGNVCLCMCVWACVCVCVCLYLWSAIGSVLQCAVFTLNIWVRSCSQVVGYQVVTEGCHPITTKLVNGKPLNY